MEAPEVEIVVWPVTAELFCACQLKEAGTELVRLMFGLCPLQMVYESGDVSVGMAAIVMLMVSLSVWQPFETLTQYVPD